MKKLVLVSIMSSLLCSTALADIEYRYPVPTPGTNEAVWTVNCNIDRVVSKRPQKMDDNGIMIHLYFPDKTSPSGYISNIAITHYLTNGNAVSRSEQYGEGSLIQPYPTILNYIWKGTHLKNPNIKMTGQLSFKEDDTITYTETQVVKNKNAYTMYSSCKLVNINPSMNESTRDKSDRF